MDKACCERGDARPAIDGVECNGRKEKSRTVAISEPDRPLRVGRSARPTVRQRADRHVRPPPFERRVAPSVRQDASAANALTVRGRRSRADRPAINERSSAPRATYRMRRRTHQSRRERYGCRLRPGNRRALHASRSARRPAPNSGHIRARGNRPVAHRSGQSGSSSRAFPASLGAQLPTASAPTSRPDSAAGRASGRYRSPPVDAPGNEPTSPTRSAARELGVKGSSKPTEAEPLADCSSAESRQRQGQRIVPHCRNRMESNRMRAAVPGEIEKHVASYASASDKRGVVVRPPPGIAFPRNLLDARRVTGRHVRRWHPWSSVATANWISASFA